MVKTKGRKPRPRRRQKSLAKFQISVEQGQDISYKNIPLIQKFLNERGKIVPRRITGVTAKQQRKLVTAVKQARFLALLTSGSAKR